MGAQTFIPPSVQRQVDQAEASAGNQPPPTNDAAIQQLQTQFNQLQHSFSVLQGKYNSETAAMREALNQRDATIAELSRRLPPEDPRSKYGLTEAEAELGPDAISAFEKVAQQTVKHHIPQQPAQTPPENPAADMFFRLLDQYVPNWEQLQLHPLWAQFLQQPNIMPRFQAAQQSFDAVQMIQLFNEFKAAQQTPVPPPTWPAQTPGGIMPATIPGAPAATGQAPVDLAELQKQMIELTKHGTPDPKKVAEIDAQITAAYKTPPG